MKRPLLLCLALSTLLRADTLIVVGGADYHGKILSQENGEILINPYNSTMKQMTWGLKRFDRVNVQTVTIEPPTPLQEYWYRKGDPKADHAELLKWCQDHGLTVEAKEEALELLAKDPKDASARAALGNEADLVLKASPRHNQDLRAATANWKSLNATARREAYARLKKEFGVTLPQAYFDRVSRSAELPIGRTVEDRELMYNTRRASGVYTVWCPKNYDPHRSYPLVLALHGTWNGLGGIGEGHSFIRHITHKETQKWDIVVVSPTADPRPWTAKGDDFVLSVLAEAMLLYNIDMNRVYVTGHSMGGHGTYHFGVTYADRFAAFAPAASGPGGLDLRKAASQGTGMYIYHSSDDSIASCRGDRQAAKLLERAKADFVYTEWTDQDHGWPQEVIADSFLYFRHRHRMERGKDKPVPCRGVRPSFAEPLWPDEDLYFRPVRMPGRPGEVDELVRDVELGGRLADEAAARLLVLRDATAIPLLAAVLRNASSCDTARRQAARALGAVRQPAASAALIKALADPDLRVRVAAARSLVAVADAQDALPTSFALVELGADFEKITGKHKWLGDEHWRDWHDLNATVVEALAATGDPRTWASVHDVALVKILLTEVKSGSVHIDPVPAHAASAIRILNALPAFKEPKLKPALGRIRERFTGQPKVLEAADEAEKKL